MTSLDPYRDWLGIQQPARPLNHYDLLGVPVFTKDAALINQAADQQIARLRPHAVAANLEVAQRVAKEIVSARKLLLSAEWKKAYDAKLRTQMGAVAGASGIGRATPTTAGIGQRPPGASGIGAGGQPVAHAAMPLQTMPLQAVPVQPMGVGGEGLPVAQPVFGAPPFGQPAQGLPISHTSVTRRVRRKKSSPIIAAVVLLLFALAALGGLLFYINRETALQPADVAQQSAGPGETTSPSIAPTTAGSGSRFTQVGATLPPAVDRSSSALLGDVDPSFQIRDPAADPGQTGMSNAGQPRVVGVQRASPSGLLGSVDPAFENRPTAVDFPDGPANTGMSADGTQSPGKAPATAPEVTELPTATGDAGAVEGLQLARASAAGRKMTAAREQLAFARANAELPETKVAVERTTALLEPLDRFWTSVRTAQRQLKTHDELTVDGQVVLVVEADDSHLRAWIGDRRHRYTIETLPIALAVALAARELQSESVEGQLALGALHAVDLSGNREQARTLWQAAAGQGANVDDLLAELGPAP